MIANIVPVHDEVPGSLHRLLKKKRIPPSARVVVVAMPREKDRGSIRNDRIGSVLEGLKEWNPDLITIPSYSPENAWQIFTTVPDADFYVVLSEQVAVVLKDLLRARREDRKSRADRITGFDNGETARRANLTTFDQQLPAIGNRAIAKLRSCVNSDTSEMPFEEIRLLTTLVERE